MAHWWVAPSFSFAWIPTHVSNNFLLSFNVKECKLVRASHIHIVKQTVDFSIDLYPWHRLYQHNIEIKLIIWKKKNLLRDIRTAVKSKTDEAYKIGYLKCTLKLNTNSKHESFLWNGSGENEGQSWNIDNYSMSFKWSRGNYSKICYILLPTIKNDCGDHSTAVASMRRTEALASVKFYQILSIFIFFIRLIILEDFIRLISYNGPCVRLGCSFFLGTALHS